MLTESASNPELLFVLRINSQYDREVFAVGKYIEIMEKESELVQRELRTFLEEFPRDPTLFGDRSSEMEVSRTSFVGERLSDVDVGNPQLGISISQQIEMCGHQVTAVKNWMLGYVLYTSNLQRGKENFQKCGILACGRALKEKRLGAKRKSQRRPARGCQINCSSSKTGWMSEWHLISSDKNK